MLPCSPQHASQPAVGQSGWETFPHDADIGVRGYGATCAEAFAMAALALVSVAVDPEGVRCLEGRKIACQADDPVVLLVDWLNAIIVEISAGRLIFGRFRVAIQDGRLDGEAWGEPIDIVRHHPAAEPKGATFTEARVAREPEGRWVAQCVVDV
ncbi:archease [Alsobacter soli]|uniref:Archease n=1 Tax=Alsobacter soli TaxID=2109933 RepID=A0A2T1HMJ2_9HYPH|nr:archease [Alsobacter soli]PSC02873.1 archease [Alsobacter soli]